MKKQVRALNPVSATNMVAKPQPCDSGRAAKNDTMRSLTPNRLATTGTEGSNGRFSQTQVFCHDSFICPWPLWRAYPLPLEDLRQPDMQSSQCGVDMALSC